MNLRFWILWVGVLVVATSAPYLGPLTLLGCKYVKTEITSVRLRERTYQNVVRPSTRWVLSFREKEGRLPTHDEVMSFGRTNNRNYPAIIYLYDTNPNWKESAKHSWRSGVDFMIRVPVGDWNL